MPYIILLVRYAIYYLLFITRFIMMKSFHGNDTEVLSRDILSTAGADELL